jgi:hypothetical protein
MRNRPNRACHTSDRRGYTLLFAVLTAALALGVAVFIMDVTRKQYELAVASRNSIYSFYAADSGIECAVNASNWTTAFSSTTGGTLSCDGAQAALSSVSSPQISPSGLVVADPGNPSGNPIRQWIVSIPLTYTVNSLTIRECAAITFTTGWSTSNSQAITVTDSRGYNLCTSAVPPVPNSTNPETVERALRLSQIGLW